MSVFQLSQQAVISLNSSLRWRAPVHPSGALIRHGAAHSTLPATARLQNLCVGLQLQSHSSSRPGCCSVWAGWRGAEEGCGGGGSGTWPLTLDGPFAGVDMSHTPALGRPHETEARGTSRCRRGAGTHRKAWPRDLSLRQSVRPSVLLVLVWLQTSIQSSKPSYSPPL